jgi:tetratricopeptide (TPR) repeat protein
VARKGGGVVREDRETASSAWRAVVERARDNEPTAPEEWEPEVWVEDEPEPRPKRQPPKQAVRAPGNQTAPAPRQNRDRKAVPVPEPVAAELHEASGPKRAPRLAERLADAAGMYERSRFDDARRILKGLSEEAPRAAAVRELNGLTLYRLGRWLPASKELEAYRSITGSVDQHPALADCYRALGKWKKVQLLWEELKEASPSAELVAEGRIVAAGALADHGDARGGIALLEAGRIEVARPKEHHLRMQYALADLYERAGDVPRARELFRRIQTRDPEFFDIADRIKALA